MWRDVPDYEGYQASDDGRIRNRRKKILKQHSAGRDQAMRVNMGGRTGRVHNLVAAAFFGTPATPGYRVEHINGDFTDNAVWNLWYWGRPREPRRSVHRPVGDRCTKGHFLAGADVRYWGAGHHRICVACERGDPPNLETREII